MGSGGPIWKVRPDLGGGYPIWEVEARFGKLGPFGIGKRSGGEYVLDGLGFEGGCAHEGGRGACVVVRGVRCECARTTIFGQLGPVDPESSLAVDAEVKRPLEADTELVGVG